MSITFRSNWKGCFLVFTITFRLHHVLLLQFTIQIITSNSSPSTHISSHAPLAISWLWSTRWFSFHEMRCFILYKISPPVAARSAIPSCVALHIHPRLSDASPPCYSCYTVSSLRPCWNKGTSSSTERRKKLLCLSLYTPFSHCRSLTKLS